MAARPSALYGGGSDSDEESEGSHSVGEIQETRPARRWVSDSESDSDQERGKVLSEKERKWNALTSIGVTISNALKGNDWSKVNDGRGAWGGRGRGRRRMVCGLGGWGWIWAVAVPPPLARRGGQAGDGAGEGKEPHCEGGAAARAPVCLLLPP